MTGFLARLVATGLVVAVPVVVLGVLLGPWMVAMGPNGSPAPGLDELPVELWPLIVLLPAVWLLLGLRVVWRRPYQ